MCTNHPTHSHSLRFRSSRPIVHTWMTCYRGRRTPFIFLSLSLTFPIISFPLPCHSSNSCPTALHSLRLSPIFVLVPPFADAAAAATVTGFSGAPDHEFACSAAAHRREIEILVLPRVQVDYPCVCVCVSERVSAGIG